MNQPRTMIGIDGARFTRNLVPTHAGRRFQGHDIEGLLFIARMANAIVDDRNQATRGVWAYPDGPWDPARNSFEFGAALPLYRRHGLDAVGLNMQGGSPQGYSWNHPWNFSGFAADGTPLSDTLGRLEHVLDAADAAGMVVVLGLFYGWASRRLVNEAAVIRALDATIAHVMAGGWRNVLIEIGDNIDSPGVNHPIIGPGGCAELITRVREATWGQLKVSTSCGGGAVPPDHIIAVCDFILLHGNTVNEPARITAMVEAVRASAGYRGQPILFNEDDHTGFDAPDNNMLAAMRAGAGWGFFDYRRIGEGFTEGYQSLPVDWGINSARKRRFFGLLADITGHKPP